jgi:Ca-activated chloride channel family protein
MNTNKISPDDPRLTTYALGEMEPREQAEFAQLLQEDPVAAAAVEEIRATAQVLGTALETERVHLEVPVPSRMPAAPARKKVLRFPQLYFMVSGLAAACFAVFFLYWEQQQKPMLDQKRYVEVTLAKAQAAPAKTAPENKPADGTLVAVELPSPTEAAPAAPPEAAQSVAPVQALTATGPAGAGNRLDESDKPIVLSPFTVQASVNQGYAANNTLAGTRVVDRTKDTEYAGSARARQVADDIGAVHARDSLTYAIKNESLGMVSGFMANETAKKALGGSNTETYARQDENPFLTVAQNPLSTFSIDVDTASYANVRRFLIEKQRPPPDAVRIEEMVNYFPYRYPAPAAGGAPFAASLEVAATPWAPTHRLVRVGLKGREVSDAARPAANLVFLLDVSGSMDEPNKLPLVKESLKMLVGKLRPDDRVAIVVYAGASGLALPSTSAAEKTKILNAIDELQPGGSTNGAAGIQLAYDIAKANFVIGGVNRVILATDGDFNVGTTSEGELTRLIEEKAHSGVFLTVLGFGMGNYKDAMLVKLADKGNGNYAYIDTAAEAHKALVEQAGGTLVTIAKDVKIQVEFNPAQVQAYRLIGYEKRMLRTEDFNNDKVDAGEIGAGHTVTALYEVVPVGAAAPAGGSVDPLKYQKTKDAGPRIASNSDELLTVKIRYKEPAGDVSSKVEFALRDEGHRFEEASTDFKFSAAVAAFGLILRDSPQKGSATLADVASWGRAGLEQDPGGYRAEFLELVALAGEAAP